MKLNRRLIAAVLGMALSSPFGYVASSLAEPPVASVPKKANGQRHEGFLKDKAELLKRGPIHVVFIGDSITDGWRGSQSYDKAFAEYNPYNIGISGEHTEHVLWRLTNEEIDGISPELLVMMIGTNNLAHNPRQAPVDVADGIKTLVETIKAKQPKAKILLLGIFPRDEQPTGELRKKVAETNAIISKLDDGGATVKFLDIGPKFLDDKGVLSKEIMPDSLHPNGKGQEIWAAAIKPIVDEMLKGVEKIEPKHFDAYRPPQPKDQPTVAAIKDPNRHEQFLKDKEALLKKGPIQFLAVGDSITDGWRRGESFEKAFGAYNPYNIGIGGDRTQHVLWRLENGEVDGIKPKVAMVMIGTNNIGNPSNDEIVAGVTKIVTTLRAKLPETKVLLLGIFPRDEKPGTNSRNRIKAMNEALAKLDDGGKTVKFLDIGDKFLDAEGNIPKDVMPDALHPTEKGHQIWAEAIKPTLDEMMK